MGEAEWCGCTGRLRAVGGGGVNRGGRGVLSIAEMETESGVGEFCEPRKWKPNQVGEFCEPRKWGRPNGVGVPGGCEPSEGEV